MPLQCPVTPLVHTVLVNEHWKEVLPEAIATVYTGVTGPSMSELHWDCPQYGHVWHGLC
jgi:hypothetical protein